MKLRTLSGALLLGLLMLAPTRAEDLRKRVGLDQLLGAQLPPDAMLKDESGADLRVGRFFGPRPMILTFVYFDCPMLCNEVTNAELRTLRALNLKLGEDYDVLTISIDPEDTPEKARARKARYLNRYDLPGAEVGWHVLTGGAEASRRLAESVGFRYTYNKETRQYTHAAGLMVLTPEGKVARYFYGVSYPPRDVRLALTEASEGKLGSVVDQMLLFCYQYDPSTGHYTLAILNLVRVACVATVLALATFVWKATRRDRSGAGPGPAFT
jgi:protein SCO1/2